VPTSASPWVASGSARSAHLWVGQARICTIRVPMASDRSHDCAGRLTCASGVSEIEMDQGRGARASALVGAVSGTGT
jgi:hypothetical protein